MKRLLSDLTRTRLGLAGAFLATVTGLLLVTLLVLSLAGFEGGPYFGLLAFMLLPALFVAGLLLIPAGAWLERRRIAHGGAPSPPLPVLDLNDVSSRRKVLWIAGLTVINVIVVAVATYRGVHAMESPAFCGSCHTVMDPEFSAYSRSPHQRVRCVECHIGPGASWFVKSKLSGSWQMISVMLHLYPTPIPTPVENLRPARDTCEQCHWPTKFVGDRLKVLTHHDEDEASTPTKTVLVLRVGGLGAGGGQGIHHHVSPGVVVRYQADARREVMGAVEVTHADGTRLTYLPKAGTPPASPDGEWRTMDCIDCHNRPTHQFRGAEWELDQALESGRVDRTLPFLRREGLKAMTAPYGSPAEARQGIEAALAAFYARERPEVLAQRGPAVTAAAAELAEAWARNVWPQMKITWGTYPSQLGHVATPGCFRCHDEEHATAEGKVLSQDCGLCHTLLADGEHDPAILKQLSP
ncbi:MAG: NapC/NirT family cytochrome c [Anaeromyxobacter sp.]|nr:NapC/NirT family cytochrome c [Anaeromyxobacter sp.]MBL0276843.1 NapC/NirT family cytochrome c [Anaeromyxobacter sp.]